MKLKTQIILALALVAFICTVGISIVANIELRIHFHAYLSQIQMEQGMSGYEPVYSDFDKHFIQTINRVFWMMGVAVLLLAAAIGTFLANRIHKPIQQAIDATVALSNGNKRLELKTGKGSAKELQQLGRAVEKLSESLLTQEQLRKQLTTNVAHELRTPLATLKSHIELMMEGIWQPTADRLNSCYEEVERLTRLIADLDQLERYDQALIQLNRQWIEAEPLARSVTELMAAKFEQKGIELQVEAGNFKLFADPDKLKQILINLLANALQYTLKGKVTLGLLQAGNQAIISVRDTGIGIPQEDQPHIFERFYRVDPSRNRETGGTGIGLSIVKAIVEAHEGSIALESHQGQGTIFIVTIPISYKGALK